MLLLLTASSSIKTRVPPMRCCFRSVFFPFFFSRLSSLCHSYRQMRKRFTCTSVRPLQGFCVLCILESLLVFSQFFFVTESIIQSSITAILCSLPACLRLVSYRVCSCYITGMMNTPQVLILSLTKKKKAIVFRRGKKITETANGVPGILVICRNPLKSNDHLK